MGICLCKDRNNKEKSSKLLDDHHHHHPGERPRAWVKAEKASMIKVVTATGGIMELYAPITVEQITSEFPNHGLFLSPNPIHAPLVHNDTLNPGHPYYLLPLSLSSPRKSSSSTLYRMTVDAGPRVVHKKNPDPDVVTSRYKNGTGVWKVRLVINPEHLSEILSQDNETQQLIKSVRTVAKCSCGPHTTTMAAPVAGGLL